MTETQAYTQRVWLLRQEFNRQLQSGVFSSSLAEKIERLKKEEQELLTRALPVVRRQVLERRDPQTVISSLVRAKGTPKAGMSFALTRKELDEAGLPEEKIALCEQLLSLDPPDEPWIPQEQAESQQYAGGPGTTAAGETAEEAGTAARENAEGPGTTAGERAEENNHPPQNENQAMQEFSGTPYMSVHNDSTCFLFLDDGSVILYENNDGWQRRSTPILQECFAENAMMESNHSCLLLNLDHGIDRLSYHRLSTPDDLLHFPLFPG